MTREEAEAILDAGITFCPKHQDGGPGELGVCPDCDAITAVWADFVVGESRVCAAGERELPEIRWARETGEDE